MAAMPWDVRETRLELVQIALNVLLAKNTTSAAVENRLELVRRASARLESTTPVVAQAPILQLVHCALGMDMLAVVIPAVEVPILESPTVLNAPQGNTQTVAP